MLPFLEHKIVKEWLQKHTDTSITGRCKSRPVLIGQSILVLYSNGPLVRDLTLPSLSVTSTNLDNSRAILIIDADLVDV